MATIKNSNGTKEKKPTVKQLRPIALTNASYKLFMRIVKHKIEEHMHEIRQQSEVQTGFTKRRRIVDNLSYCNIAYMKVLLRRIRYS